MKVITITNQKGGVGKTTLAFHLVSLLAELNERVLAIDMDPQGNFTSIFWPNGPVPATQHIKNIFTNMPPLPMRVKIGGVDEVDLVGSDIQLSTYATEMKLDNYFALKSFVESRSKDYSYVVIDTPPSLGLFTLASVIAATHIVIPTDISMFSLLGIDDLLNTIRRVEQRMTFKPQVVGIIVMGHQERIIASQEIVNALRRKFGKFIIGTVPHSTRIREAVNFERVPVWRINPDYKAAVIFKDVLIKLLKRIEL